MTLAESQERIDERVSQGGSLAQVEKEIIDSAPSGEEQRAALWLYASATIPRDLAEAVVETAKQRRPRLGRLSSALRSAPSALLRTRAKVQGGGQERSILAGRERVDLQREADEERTGVIRSEEDRQHLESFKQGEVDRWGREASIGTPIEDSYTERR